MSEAFVATLRARIGLTDVDAQRLAREGVDSLAAAQRALTALLREPGHGAADVECRCEAIEALASLRRAARARRRAAPDPRRFTSGGAPPSGDALRDLTPQRVEALLCEAVPDAYRLNGLAAIDLLDDALRRRWVVRDQGVRGTCVAFAVTACLELLAYRAGDGLESLSPQFLYHTMRTHDWPEFPHGWDEGATKLGQAMEVLMRYGVCSWALMPYTGYPGRGAPIEGAPPDERARDEALARTVRHFSYADYPRTQERPANGVARDIYRELQLGRAVAAGVPQFRSTLQAGRSTWKTDVARQTGIVGDPAPGASVESAESGHVMCIVGFQPDDDEATGGWFVFRNSWGLSWGHRAPTRRAPPVVPGDGHGAISASYIEKFCWEWLSPRLHPRSHSR